MMITGMNNLIMDHKRTAKIEDVKYCLPQSLTGLVYLQPVLQLDDGAVQDGGR